MRLGAATTLRRRTTPPRHHPRALLVMQVRHDFHESRSCRHPFWIVATVRRMLQVLAPAGMVFFALSPAVAESPRVNHGTNATFSDPGRPSTPSTLGTVPPFPSNTASTSARRAVQQDPARNAQADPRSTYDFGSGEPCPFCAITPGFPEAPSGLHWHSHWRGVGTADYGLTAAFAAIAIGAELLVRPELHADWDTPILFDRAARNALRLGSGSARSTAKTVSDVLFWASIAQPLIDNIVVAWWLRESPRVAWQMFAINAQAYAMSLALNGVTKRLTSRARPWANTCDDNSTDPKCATGDAYRSFYSGHAAITATGAGLICAHHTQLSLYRNDYLDTGACVTAVLGTAITGALRVASDNHWASDVVIGHLTGYLAGYLYPTLMYYREFRVAPEGPEEHAPPPGEAPVITVIPLLTPTNVQLSFIGMF